MNKVFVVSALVVGIRLFRLRFDKDVAGYERSVENKMAVIQEKIGDGLKPGHLRLINGTPATVSFLFLFLPAAFTSYDYASFPISLYRRTATLQSGVLE